MSNSVLPIISYLDLHILYLDFEHLDLYAMQELLLMLVRGDHGVLASPAFGIKMMPIRQYTRVSF